MRTVDCHAHFIPPSIMEAMSTGVHPGVGLVQDDGVARRAVFPDLEPSPPIPEVITNRAAALAWQRDRGIDVQLLSPWTDLFGYTLEEDDAVAWSDRYNEALVAEAADTSHFEVLGTVPLGRPGRTVEVLGRALELGCVGIMIGTHAPGVELDDRRLDPFWASLAARRVPVAVHPIFLARDPRLADYGLFNTVGRANETTVAVARLLFGGVLERHPDLRIVVVHGGGAVPTLLARLARNHAVFHPGTADPQVGFDRLYFDSVVLDPTVLAALVHRVGTDRVVLGSDYPFPWEPDPAAIVAAAGLDTEESAAILGTTATELFDLDTHETGTRT